MLNYLPCLMLLLLPALAWAQPDLVECQRVPPDQLRAASPETLQFLRCRARRIAYEAPRLKGVTQKTRDDLMFACLDQADAVEHQLRVAHGFTRNSLARLQCNEP